MKKEMPPACAELRGVGDVQRGGDAPDSTKTRYSELLRGSGQRFPLSNPPSGIFPRREAAPYVPHGTECAVHISVSECL
ncbi:hypothetical protein EYF80_020699 [Liparis tanakae]|uniref:Uncharacterized protein n=1 Tax=Liparis tanakae TaxID=230148 RepID=A0A4Z2HTD4_9TELE|nr:hypothetical protein EYF80_020699 [Liparis tanakae]